MDLSYDCSHSNLLCVRPCNPPQAQPTRSQPSSYGFLQTNLVEPSQWVYDSSKHITDYLAARRGFNDGVKRRQTFGSTASMSNDKCRGAPPSSSPFSVTPSASKASSITRPMPRRSTSCTRQNNETTTESALRTQWHQETRFDSESHSSGIDGAKGWAETRLSLGLPDSPLA